jgi:tetratricopeptide (TPR) repeat protein
MGCGSSSSAIYHYKDGSPVRPVKVRMSIKRRESFVQANTILVHRVAHRLHEEWRSTRLVKHHSSAVSTTLVSSSSPTSTSTDTLNTTLPNTYEPFIETIGQAKINVASLTWEELPESLKNRKLKAIGLCSDAILNQLRDHNNTIANKKSSFKTSRTTIRVDPNDLDSIAELEYMFNDDSNLLPWEALTASERAQYYKTTLCVVSEWNEMMKQAEQVEQAESKLHASVPNATDALNVSLTKSNLNMLSRQQAETRNNGSHASLAIESKYSVATSYSTSSNNDATSPFAKSVATSNDSTSNTSLSQTFSRGGMTRVMSGRDVLKEIRQTIRVGNELNQNEQVQKKKIGARQRMRWAAMRIAESTRAHLRKQIRKNKHFVRVFVSSTFRDFHAERDYLFQRVFPRLESACAEVGILFIPVDLRWGVTTKEALDGQVIKLCLQEVDTCRPFFVAMLGERYGWHVDASLPQSGDKLLKKTFDEASITFPFVKKWRDRSATEIEIRHAVLNNPKQKMQSFFFLRDPNSTIVTDATVGNESAIQNFQSESPHAKTLQDQLKDSIRTVESSQHRVTDGYSTLEELGKTLFKQLKAAIEHETNKNDWVSTVSKVMDEGGDQPLDAAHASRTETERLVFVRNEAVGQAFRHVYVKDMALFGRIEDLCGSANKDNTPLVLVGGPGLGKSALLANLSESSSPQLASTISVILYIGSQYQSPTISEVVVDIVHLVRRAVQKLRNRRNKSKNNQHARATSEPMKNTMLRRKASSAVLAPKEHQQPITETDALDSPLDLLNKLFEEAGHELRKMNKTLLIGLDGIDRISDDSIQPMSWLPVATPLGVQLILSLATGEKSMDQSSDVAPIGSRVQHTTMSQQDGGTSSWNGHGDAQGHESSMGTGTATGDNGQTRLSAITAISPHVILGRRVTRMLKVVSTRKWNIIEITPMSSNRGQQLVTTFLNLYGKKFDNEQMTLVQQAKHTENPLYMITLLNEIRKFGSFENLGDQLNLYLKAEDITSLFSLVLSRLDEEIGNNIVSMAARVIWVARSGVSEHDLKTILLNYHLIPEETYDDFRHRTRDIFINRANLISFVHVSLADAVEDSYFNETREIEKARNIFVKALKLQADSENVQRTRTTIISASSASAAAAAASSPTAASASPTGPSAANNWNHDHAARGDWWYYIRELAYQYSMLKDWNELSLIVGRLTNFILFTEFDPELLIRYWRQLRLQHIRPNTVYQHSFEIYSKEQASIRVDSLEKRKEKETTETDTKETDTKEKEQRNKTTKQPTMRRQSTVPSRRRSLAGVDVEMLLAEPLSKAGQLLVDEYQCKMTLALELELIDSERDVLLKLVRFFQMMGEYRIALEYSKSALHLMEKVPRAFFGVVEVSSMLIEMAELEHKLHEFENAMTHLNNALLTLVSFLNEHPNDHEVKHMHIVVLGDMANLYKETGHYDDALLKFDEALIWTTQYLGPNDVECSVHLNNLANLLMEEHRYEDALSKYERSLLITKSYYGQEHPEVARTLHNVGLCLKHLGHYGNAMDHFMAAVKMMVDALGTYHPEVGTVLNNVSVLCSMLARNMEENIQKSKSEDDLVRMNEFKSKQKSLYVQAQQAAERSVVIRERSLGSNHPTLSGAYTNLGKIYLLTGNTELSSNCYERAVEIASKKLGENHPLVGRGLAQLGRIASRGGDLITARAKFQRAVKSLRMSMGVLHAFTQVVEKNLTAVERKLTNTTGFSTKEYV